jgi:hypothetical protein
MARVALLSNPRSTGNRHLLPRVRSYCAHHPEIFHYEVESVSQIGEALKTIARVNPKVLVLNGGDGTVQASLTELHQGGHFPNGVPPVAVLPNGKTNLIALDLGATGDALAALDRVLQITGDDMDPHIVDRELIALSDGNDNTRPVLGMFLGGAGLADSILFCRNRIYPLGLPNALSHALTVLVLLLTAVIGWRASFLPARPERMSVSVRRQGELHGRFALLMVTTLERLLLNTRSLGAVGPGSLKLMAVENRPGAVLRAMGAAALGRLGRDGLRGIHIGRGDEIHIEGERSAVLLDGELFEAGKDRPIILTHTAPVPFLSLAA